MKYVILLLLITISCLGQTKVTAYRLVNEADDGPCSVKTYLEHIDEMPLMSVVYLESFDEGLCKKLLDIKKRAVKWEKANFNCGDKVIGGDMIHNMFVLEGVAGRDTLYLTKENDYLVWPDKGVAYFDKKCKIKQAFIPEIKEFFDHNFDTQIKRAYLMAMDSVSLEKIVYKGNVLGRKNVKEDISVIVTNDDVIVDGLKVGDHENVLKSKFPMSTVYKSIWSSRYEDHKDPKKYYYVVEIGESKVEHVAFNIESKKIVSIEVNIYGSD